MYSFNKLNPRGRGTARKISYDLLKLISSNIKIIRSSSDHAIFLWVYKNYKLFLAVETDEILLAT